MGRRHCLKYCLCHYETFVLAFIALIPGQNDPMFTATIVMVPGIAAKWILCLCSILKMAQGARDESFQIQSDK